MRVKVIGLAALPVGLAACSMHVHPGSWSVTGGAAAQGSGKRVTEERIVAAFHGVEFGGSGSVHVAVGHPKKVTVEIDDNLMKQVTTSVENGVLHIAVDGNYRSDKGLRVTVGVPTLDSLELSGSGTARVDGLKSESFEANLSGSGRVVAGGSVARLTAEITGSGEANLAGLRTKNAVVSLSGSGCASVNATESLKADISGSGRVSYSGNPHHVEKNVSGSGRVSPGR